MSALGAERSWRTELVRRAVEELRCSEGWRRWLEVRARFRRYSAHNSLLIACQRPTATRVAGMAAWRALGWRVMRRPAGVPEGAWAIRIWAPVVPSRQEVERWQKAGEPPDLRPRVRFRLVCVYAQDQVEPDPRAARTAAIEPPITPLSGEQLAGALGRLEQLAAELGCRVIRESLGGPFGCYEPAGRVIALEATASIDQQAKTLAHELSHALVRLDRRPGDPGLSYGEEELVAESAAYTALLSAGFDSGSYSIPYVAGWAQAAPLAALERAAGLVDRIAGRLESALLQDTCACDA
jgi:hypothetical protein